MALVRLILDAVARPLNESVKYDYALGVASFWAEPSTMFDFKSCRYALEKPIKLKLWAKYREVISMYNNAETARIMSKDAGCGQPSSETNRLEELDVCVLPILSRISRAIQRLILPTTFPRLVVFR